MRRHVSMHSRRLAGSTSRHSDARRSVDRVTDHRGAIGGTLDIGPTAGGWPPDHGDGGSDSASIHWTVTDPAPVTDNGGTM
ncbi:MAG: hypothetical protein U5K73_11155 [Halofilum sp. (in: g-proteobacteria)]|nr:hypothetical protein [Halofilum sp. (in: g-proteobacteria)]